MSRFPLQASVFPRLIFIALIAVAMSTRAETVLVSQSSEGEQGLDYSTFPSLSDDGRFIAFLSKADNLVPGDTNGEMDVFVHDRQTRQTTRASIASDGGEANAAVGWTIKSISDNGRFVVFSSPADNLVSADNNRQQDVFLHDRESNETTRISVAGDGTEANRSSFSPGIFADGRYVTFESAADNLVPDDTNGIVDVFLHDRETGLTRRVNIASDGSEANELDRDWSWIWWYTNPVSDDGRYVAFTSLSSNLVPGDNNAAEDVFVHDLKTGETERVSVDSDGKEWNHYSLLFDMSDDGRYLAFNSFSDNRSNPPELVGDSDPQGLFVHDRLTGKTSHIPGGAGWAAFSGDGRYLAYIGVTKSANLQESADHWDVHVLDQHTGETLKATVSFRGNQTDLSSWRAAISGDGRSIAFASNATNLVPGDGNAEGDVFATDNPHLFRVNAGLNDAWYNPDTPGQGFQIMVFPLTQKMFVTWLTYDTERPGDSVPSRLGGAGQRWLTAYGPYEGRKAVLEISSTTGGVFDAAEPVPESQSSGTLTVDFTTCTNGSVSYDLSSIGQQRRITVQRISLENVPMCELLKDPD